MTPRVDEVNFRLPQPFHFFEAQTEGGKEERRINPPKEWRVNRA
jgi:hypothetical protein